MRSAASGARSAAAVAAGLAKLIVHAEICRVLALHTKLTSDLIKSLYLFFGERLGSAEHLGLIEKACVEFYGFHLVICVKKRIRESKCAVVLKKNCVKVRKILGNSVRNFLGGRRAVFCYRNASERDYSLGHDRLCKRNACDCKACSVKRMCVNNAVYVRSFLINSHMHFDFGGGLEAFVCLKYLAVCVNLAYVLGSHEALAYAGRRAEEFIIVELYGNVTVVGGYHSLVIDTLTNFADLLFDLVLCCHFSVLLWFYDFLLLFYSKAARTKSCPFFTI